MISVPAAVVVVLLLGQEAARAPQGPPPTQAIYDFAIFYGRDSRVLIANGWVPGNLFATITEGLADFAQCCARVHSEGAKPFTVRRHSG